jgi:type I restriction enzyme S subunit
MGNDMKHGWEVQFLENCFKLKSGNNLTSVDMSKYGTYPVFGGNGIAGYHNEYNLTGSNVIVGRVGALCGNVRHIKESIWLTDNAFKIVDFKFDFDNSFLTYLLNYIDLRSYARQAAQPVISNSSLKKVVLHFPKSIMEQQRIVAILDEAFAVIAKAKANAEQNLKNSRELFESYLQGVFENGNWETKTIEEVCDEIFAGGDAPKNNFSLEVNDKHGIPIYANAVKDRGLYGYTDFARVTKPSITISARGSGTGHTEIRFENYLPIVRLIVLIPNLTLINLEFLKHSIDNLEILRSGSAIPQLTVPMIKEYSLPLPSLQEQVKFVQKLDTLSAETKKLEAIYRQKIDVLEELKKSILQKAFEGEL